MLAGLRRVVNAVRGRVSPPETGRVSLPRPEDMLGAYHTDLTPARVRAILAAATSGDPSAQSAVFDQLLEHDLDLRSAQRTRRIAVTRLPWEIVSAAQQGQSGAADEALATRVADYCRETLARVAGVDAALRHLVDAVGRGVMVVEVEWGRAGGEQRPVALWPVPQTALHADPIEPWRLRISLRLGDWRGELIDESPGGKWIVHAPEPIGGGHFRGGLLRACLVAAMCKRKTIAAWQLGVEIFGLPTTTVLYDSATDAATRAEIQKMMTTLGVARGGMFPRGVELEYHEPANPGAWPHERVLAYFDAAYAKVWLGQTLTTQVGETGGANAAAQVHDQVREDIRDDDIAAEAATIREQLLVPLVRYRFGDEAAAIATPYFRRVIEEPRDDQVVASVLSIAVNDLGLQIPQRWASETLGVPLVAEADPESPIPGRTMPADPFGVPPPADTLNDAQMAAQRERRRGAAVRAMRRIAGGRSPMARLLPWVAAATLASQAHTERLLADVRRRMDGAETAHAATAALIGAFDDSSRDDMVELQRQFLLAGNLAGRETGRERIVARRSHRTAASAEIRVHADAAIDFARLPFTEAIAALRVRLHLTPLEFESLDRVARSRAFRVAGVWDMDLLALVHRELLASIEAGETVRDFRQRVLPVMGERDGWTGQSAWHSTLVHYQNLAMANSAGRYQQYREAAITHWRFVTFGDSCPICRPEAGRIYALSDTDRYPPLHFNCDCADEVVFEGEVDRSNTSAGVPNPALAQERARASGFRWDPASYAALEPLDLGRFPDELRGRFSEFARSAGWSVTGDAAT
ncbi:MAG: DUF935 family protein [Phycisphaerae bacterium]